MKILFSIVVVFISLFLNAQEPTKWNFSFNSSTNNIELKVVLEEGWHIYSLNEKSAIGPVPTTITFLENENIKLVGKVNEPQPIKAYDENFEDTLSYFEKEVVFTQKVEIRGNHFIQGTVNFMVCNSSMCLPPRDEVFKIELKK